jgi:hypothetical protein
MMRGILSITSKYFSCSRYVQQGSALNYAVLPDHRDRGQGVKLSMVKEWKKWELNRERMVTIGR